MLPEPIISDSYWVTGTLAAGRYPGSKDTRTAAGHIARFEQSGVTRFVDLTDEDDRLQPYAHLLQAAQRRECPIVDMGVPTVEEMLGTLDVIDAAIAEGEVVYVHCWGGIGRTGTVVGCWLVRHGSRPDDAIGLIRERRIDLPVFRRYPDSPQTAAQARFVHAWEPGT
jgi:hypothetical protein